MQVEPLILRLNKAGYPIEWLTREEAVTLYAKDQILWHIGDHVIKMRGGFSRSGGQTVVHIPSIFASEGDVHHQYFLSPLENKFLFRRDGNICLYCGKEFRYQELSRDHVKPISRGGRDHWKNVVTACKKCNQRKGCRTPEEANMQLLAVPFEPNKYEFLYLANRNVLADQMDFLKAHFSGKGTLM